MIFQAHAEIEQLHRICAGSQSYATFDPSTTFSPRQVRRRHILAQAASTHQTSSPEQQTLHNTSQVWPLTRFQFPLHLRADKETTHICDLRDHTISSVTKCVTKCATKFLSLSKWGVFDSIKIWNLNQDGTQESRPIVWHRYQKFGGKTICSFPALALQGFAYSVRLTLLAPETTL